MRRATTSRAAAPAAARKPAPAAARSPAPDSALGLLHLHLSYTSHDLDGVRRFYGELLGMGRASETGSPRYLRIAAGASGSIGFGPPEEGPPEGWRPPGEPLVVLEVADVDAAHRDLTARGASFDQPPRDTSRGYRVALLRDPEGRRVCLAQAVRRRA